VLPLERDVVGSNIDFNEDMAVQVFPPDQGLILKLFAKVGDDVQRTDLGSGQDKAVLVAGPTLLDGKALAREPGDRDHPVEHALPVQQVAGHLAGRSACRKDRQRPAAERMCRACDIDPAAAGIVRGASQRNLCSGTTRSVTVAMSSARFIVRVTIAAIYSPVG
jgi:hypothetical protein